jgi:exopolyphosphatase/pppGpp-phosphohydrolase
MYNQLNFLRKRIMTIQTTTEVNNMKELIKKLVADVTPFYSNNDSGHDIRHGKQVILEAHRLCGAMGVDERTHRIVLTAAAWHDAQMECRETHHEDGAQYVIKNAEWFQLTYGLGAGEVQEVAQAIRTHRASYKGEYTSDAQRIVAAADRGRPGPLKEMLKRACAFGVEHTGLELSEAKANACYHMYEKYGREGYATYPDFYIEIFKDELEVLWDQIDALNHTAEQYDLEVA